MKCGLTIWDCSTSFTGCDWIEVRRIRDTTLDMNPVRCVAEKYLAAGNRSCCSLQVNEWRRPFRLPLQVVFLVSQIDDSPGGKTSWLRDT